jgi:hypothetical protein
MDYGLSLPEEPAQNSFSAEDALEAAKEQARRWGFDPEPVTVEEQEISQEWITLAVEIPGEIRILHRPHTGYAAYRSLFRAFGQALHHTGIASKRHFLEQESPAILEGTARIFEAVLRDRRWLAEHTRLSEAEIEAHLRAERNQRILELRRKAANTAFENLVYTQTDLDPQRLHSEVTEQMLHDTSRPGVLWPTVPHFVFSPLGQFSSIVGSMIGAQTWQHLNREFPEAWKHGGAGNWLRQEYFEPGAGLAWERKVKEATKAPVSIEPLARDLHVTFDGPTLEEGEGISDQEAEDYFKDIDLTDLE